MKTFEVRSIEIQAPFEVAVRYISDAANLPKWTSAFEVVENGHARMATPSGCVEVELTVEACAQHGSIDWTITFPDNSSARAFSRVVPVGPNSIAYTFVLTAPPVALEQIEGALERQTEILGEELERLRRLLEQ